MPVLKKPEVLAVDAVILHIVDPPGRNRKPLAEARGLRLSERSLPPSTDPRVFDYFRSHVEQALGDPDVRAARFVDTPSVAGADVDGVPVPEVLGSLLADESALVGDSGRLARRLFAIMEPRERISSGDLAVCLCRGRGGQGDWSHFVAVLKIDPTEGFRQVIAREGGKTYVTVELADEAIEVLPTTRQKLQKAAFVPTRAKRRGYDLLLLDLQTSARLPGQIARFFVEDFLGAEVLPLGEVRQSQILWEQVVAVRNEYRPDLDADAMRRHEERFAGLVKGQKATTIEKAAGAFEGPARERLKASLTASLPAEEVEIDAGYVDKVLRKRTFRGDGNLKVEASAEAWPRLLQEATWTGSYWRIVLRTETWREVP